MNATVVHSFLSLALLHIDKCRSFAALSFRRDAFEIGEWIWDRGYQSAFGCCCAVVVLPERADFSRSNTMRALWT